MKPRSSLGLAALVTLGLVACAGVEPPASSARPVSELLSAESIAERHHILGIGVADEAVEDRYGEYVPLDVWAPARIADLDGALVDDELRERDQYELGQAAQTAASFVIEEWIDPPVVWSDDPQQRAQLWDRLSAYIPNVEPFREHYEAAPRGVPFALVDDNRGRWREGAGLEPHPYVESQPRVAVLDVRLSFVEVAEFDGYAAERFTFEVEYARAVTDGDGRDLWERVDGRISVVTTTAGGYFGAPQVVALSWGMDTRLGQFIDTGKVPALMDVTSVGPGSLVFFEELSIPIPEGWSTTSDLDRARERGLRLSDPESTDVQAAFFEGPETSMGSRAYVFVALYSPSEDHVTAAEVALMEADLGVPAFWADDDLGGRVDVPGANGCTLSVDDDRAPGRLSRLSLRCELDTGRQMLVSFFVEPGKAAPYIPYLQAVTVVATER